MVINGMCYAPKDCKSRCAAKRTSCQGTNRFRIIFPTYVWARGLESTRKLNENNARIFPGPLPRFSMPSLTLGGNRRRQSKKHLGSTIHSDSFIRHPKMGVLATNTRINQLFLKPVSLYFPDFSFIYVHIVFRLN